MPPIGPDPSPAGRATSPRVTRQAPTDRPVISSRPGSVLSEAISIDQLAGDWIKILVYGQNRVGKTTLACTFPKPLLLVSFEPNETGGAKSVRAVKGVTFLHLRSSKKAHDLVRELTAENPFKTVVIDTVTSYQEVVLQEVTGMVKIPEQLSFGAISGEQYRERAERVKEGLWPYVDLKCHTVFLGKEKDHNPPKEEKVGANGKVQPDMRPRFLRGIQMESFVSVDLGGSTVGWIQDACDYIGRLYFDREVVTKQIPIPGGEVMTHIEETGRFVRCLRTQYHPNFAAGFRCENHRNVPEAIPDPTYDRISRVIRGEPLDK